MAVRTHKVTGIITKCSDFRDYDKMVKVLTPENGLLTVAAFGIKSASKRGKLPCTQPFVLVEIEMTEHDGMYAMKSSDVVETFNGVFKSVERYSTGCIMMEAISDCIMPNEDSGEAFLLLYRTLSALSTLDIDRVDLLDFFLLRLVDILGYTPCLSECVSCGESVSENANVLFSIEQGGVVCSNCVQSKTYLMEPICIKAMYRMLILDYDNLFKLKMPERVRTKLRACLTEYIEYYLEIKLLTDLKEK